MGVGFASAMLSAHQTLQGNNGNWNEMYTSMNLRIIFSSPSFSVKEKNDL